MKSTIVTPVSVPPRERKWVDVNPGSYDHECYVISKAMSRLQWQTEHPLARHICARAAHHRTHRTDVSLTQHAWLKIAHCSVSKTTCHPSVMSQMLPHLPQNISTRSLSPTSLVFRPSSPSLSCPISAHSGLDYETLQWRTH